MKLQARTRTMIIKIVYYGAGMSGKTTNIRSMHRATAPEQRGDLIELNTEVERTLFFDFFPQNLGTLGGFRLRVHFFSVPGQSFYSRTRRAVLEGADGVVFVADSAARREQANQQAWADLERQMNTLRLTNIPIVLQWNKRDLADAMPVELMERSLNPRRLPSCEATAVNGEGVHFTQALVVREVIKQLRETELKDKRSSRSAAPSAGAR